MCLSLEEERGESADGRGETRSRCVCEGGRTRVPHYDAAPAWEFFFTASGNQTRLSLAPESLSSGVFPSAFEAAAAIAATGPLPLRPPPSSAVPSAGSRFQKQRGKPTSNGDLVDLQVPRETAVPSSCRKTLPTETKGVELENATTDTEVGANLVGRRPGKRLQRWPTFSRKVKKVVYRAKSVLSMFSDDETPEGVRKATVLTSLACSTHTHTSWK